MEPCAHGERLGGDHDVDAGHLDFARRHLENGAVDAETAERRRGDRHQHDDQSAILLPHGVSVTCGLRLGAHHRDGIQVDGPKVPPNMGEKPPRIPLL